MIIGIGLDLIGVARIKAVHQRQGLRFLNRIYSTEEQSYCMSHREPAERLAARWAAKEACMKALGTGWSGGITFLDIEVRLLPSGAPTLHLGGAARQRADHLGVDRHHITLTHSDGMAVAMVVLEQLPPMASQLTAAL